MKCEKCGLEILEGTVCENCKNTNYSETQQSIIPETQNVIEQVPEQYDPVANLMNETVTETVNTVKSELESSIPLGDNNAIPATPVNENVVNVVSQTSIEPSTTADVVDPVNQTTVVQEQSQASAVQNQPQTPVVEEKKKTKTSTIIIIAVVVVLGLFIIFFVLPLINATKTTLGMFNQASASTFVTEVQSVMDDSEKSFMQDALESAGRGIIHTNINGVKEEDSLVKQIEDFDKENISYYIELNRNGEYQRVIVYNEGYCYDTSNYSQELDDFTKVNVSINDIRMRGKNDSENGCTGEKPEM